MQESRRRGRPKVRNKPISPDNSNIRPLSHPHEVARVLNTLDGISAASADIIRRHEVCPICNCLRQNPSQITFLALGRKPMFTYCYVGQSIRPFKITMGRDRAAQSIHRPTSSKVPHSIWAVSRYILLHINRASLKFCIQYSSRHSTNSELKRFSGDRRWYNWSSAGRF